MNGEPFDMECYFHGTGFMFPDYRMVYPEKSSDDESERSSKAFVDLTPQNPPFTSPVILPAVDDTHDEKQRCSVLVKCYSGPKQKQSQEPTLEEFERHKGIIIYLYDTLKWKLAEVDRCMRQKFNFAAK